MKRSSKEENIMGAVYMLCSRSTQISMVDLLLELSILATK